MLNYLFSLFQAFFRAFSRHKLIHSRLRANLKDTSLDNQFFIKYNFEVIIGVANREVEEIEVLQTISPLEEAEQLSFTFYVCLLSV